jgi:hypothetical protein
MLKPARPGRHDAGSYAPLVNSIINVNSNDCAPSSPCTRQSEFEPIILPRKLVGVDFGAPRVPHALLRNPRVGPRTDGHSPPRCRLARTSSWARLLPTGRSAAAVFPCSATRPRPWLPNSPTCSPPWRRAPSAIARRGARCRPSSSCVSPGSESRQRPTPGDSRAAPGERAVAVPRLGTAQALRPASRTTLRVPHTDHSRRLRAVTSRWLPSERRHLYLGPEGDISIWF